MESNGVILNDEEAAAVIGRVDVNSDGKLDFRKFLEMVSGVTRSAASPATDEATAAPAENPAPPAAVSAAQAANPVDAALPSQGGKEAELDGFLSREQVEN